MDVIIWVTFLASLAVMMILSRWTLWGGILVAGLIIGVVNLSLTRMGQVTWDTIKDPSIMYLALAVGLIPLIGGVMDRTGQMTDIVNNLRIPKGPFMGFSSGFMGLLPVPGGALLSAPLLEKAGPDVSPARKSAINVWFRHIIVIVYPLGTLLPTTKMAGLDLYATIPYMIPASIAMIVLGWLFTLRDIEGKVEFEGAFDGRRLGLALGVILLTPFLHILLITMIPGVVEEGFLVVAVLVGLSLAMILGQLRPRELSPIIRKVRPWNFFLIIVCMFLFLNIFEATSTPDQIALLPVDQVQLLVVVGALLGFATGRIHVPISIIIPIHFAKFGLWSISPTAFALMFTSVVIGYIISPVHPCISVSVEYFKSKYTDMVKALVAPSILLIAGCYIVGMMVL